MKLIEFAFVQEKAEIIYHIIIQKIVLYIQEPMIMIRFRAGIKQSVKKTANIPGNI